MYNWGTAETFNICIIQCPKFELDLKMKINLQMH